MGALKELGVDIHPILCGDGNPLFQEREQYLSATNFMAFAPGKALGYRRHESARGHGTQSQGSSYE